MFFRITGMVLATAFLLMGVSVFAQTPADMPRDPDFSFSFAPGHHDMTPVPRPALDARPVPRDSRKLSGAFAPDAQGTLRRYSVGGPATSTCIGLPVSTLCAVETYIAGSAAANMDLLREAYGPFAAKQKFASTADLAKGPPTIGQTRIYRVFGVMQLTAKDATSARAEGDAPWYPRAARLDAPWRAGDVQVQILTMSCPTPDAATCETDGLPVTYTLRETAPGRWAVIDLFRPLY